MVNILEHELVEVPDDDQCGISVFQVEVKDPGLGEAVEQALIDLGCVDVPKSREYKTDEGLKK